MDTALRAGVAVLERSVAYCLGSVTLVAPPMLARPTPCAGWNLRDLLNHVIDSMAALEEAVTTGRVTMTSPAGAGDVLLQLRERASRLVGAWAHACGASVVRVAEARLTTPLGAGAGATELEVPGWVRARGCG